MPTKDESFQKQHVHTQKEHAQWLDKLHTWRAEHKRALAKLARLQATMMEHDAQIEEHLGHVHRHEQLIERHERQIAAQKTNGDSTLDGDATDGHADLDSAHRALRAKLKHMDKVHAQTSEVLGETLEKLDELRQQIEQAADEQTLDEPGHEGIDEDEVVREASMESFPASDSPSFNPGRT